MLQYPVQAKVGQARVEAFLMLKTKTRIQITADDKMLIQLRDKLFAGSWQLFLKELRAQLKDNPSIFRFKTLSRIKSDIQRIKRLKEYEKRRKVNIKDLL